MKHYALAVLLVLGIPATLKGQQARPEITGEEFVAKLNPKSGTVVVGDGLATLEVPNTFRFLDPAGARRFLTDAWGNPPQASEGVLGMLLPAGVDPFAEESWGVIISFDDDGYVDDADAEGIDYGDMMQKMQRGIQRANEERRRQGYREITLIGWATPPHYDPASHKLYWAKELSFTGDTVRTLNYNVRVLGRRGVLVLNAVASMPQLEQIESSMQTVIGFVEFNGGHRYSDYISGTDRKAAYGIAGLIVGATAAKVGLFKGLWLGILALKKFIVLGLAAAAAWFKKTFGKKDASAASPSATR